jgi:hypothetical protein
LSCFHVSHSPSQEEGWALVWLDVDFWAVALWRWGVPTLRGMVCPSLARWMSRSYAWAQAGFPTFPVSVVPGTRGKKICWVQIGSQEGRVGVTLDGPDAAGAIVPALPQRFGNILAAAMTELRQLGGASGDFEQGAARTCNGASEQCYEHPWGPKPDTRGLTVEASHDTISSR